jgi:uncharacterized protein YceK
MRSVGIVLALAVLSSGCSTFFNGSAPAAQPGTRYAVGAKQGFLSANAKVWLCKDGQAQAAECEEVQVTEK